MLISWLNALSERLGLHASHKALLILDVWSVHRSKEFQDWLRANHKNLLVDFVPGGCTGIGQPLDVGLNRPFKHAVKVAYHAWLVETLLEQRRKGKTLDLETGLPVLRNASVGWIWYKGTRQFRTRS